MSRVLFTFLLVGFVIPGAPLRAEDPAKQGGTSSGQGTQVLSGSNSYSGGTTVNGGALQVQSENPGVTNAGQGTGTFTVTGNISDSNTYSGTTTVSNGVLTLGNWVDTTDSVYFNSSCYGFYGYGIGGINGNVARSPTTPIPKGPVFYIITEGAGTGDSVRSVPCTGKETVLDAIGHVNGISQLSSTKIWIARPTPGSRDMSTILPVDWEAISKHGINTTNYTFQPGDRRVFGEDPLTTRSNLIGKRTAPVQRMLGIVGLTTSTLRGLSTLSAADKAVMKEFVRKGQFTDDEEFKQLILDAIRPGEQENKKAGPKAGAEQKQKQAEKSLNAASSTVTFTNSGSAVSTTFSGVIQGGGSSKLTINGGVLTVNGVFPSGEAPPHELAMRPLPAYRIEPPDVIQIEMLKLVPKLPYRVAVYDVLKIRANTPPDQPINKEVMVQADGTIDLGASYGTVHVTGMTIDGMTTTLNKLLEKLLRGPEVHVQLAKAAGVQPVAGQYLVGPDGTVNLRQYGRVCLTGKTVADARLAIQKQLATYLEAPELSVDVVAYNSKVYFIITQGAGLGDNVRRLPITGNETVLDAISQINGLSQVSSKNIWIVRPLGSDSEKANILRVDWDGITGRGATASNYQIFPRDRIYIGEDPLVTRSNLLSKKTAPVERTMGIVSLTSSMLSGLSSMSAADDAVMMELVRKGTFTSDEEMKVILQEALRLHALEREKARSKEAEKGKPGQ